MNLGRALVTVVALAGLSLAGGLAYAQTDASKTAPAVTREAPAAPARTGYAQINGLNMYYEVHGQGQPLVLVHGALMTMDLQREVIESLAKQRQVIAMELQGHGRTADAGRAMGYDVFADDVHALMQHLGVRQADVMGYSMGGGVSQQLAIRHPESVRKLVIMSAAFRRDGFYPEIVTAITGMGAEAAPYMMTSPLYDAYRAVAPQPDAFPGFLDHLGDMFRKDYDWTLDVAKIKAPALVIAGDADVVQAGHVAQLFALLGGTNVDHGQFQLPTSQLLIVPATDHMQVFLERGDVVLPVVSRFLAASMPAAQ